MKELIKTHKIQTLYVDERVHRWDYIFFENDLPNVKLQPWETANRKGYYWVSKNRRVMNFQESNQKVDTVYYNHVNALLKY